MSGGFFVPQLPTEIGLQSLREGAEEYAGMFEKELCWRPYFWAGVEIVVAGMTPVVASTASTSTFQRMAATIKMSVVIINSVCQPSLNAFSAIFGSISLFTFPSVG